MCGPPEYDQSDADNFYIMQEKRMNYEQHVDKMVKLALDFHIKTGVDIETIKKFIKDIGDISTEFAAKVVADEFRKHI